MRDLEEEMGSLNSSDNGLVGCSTLRQECEENARICMDMHRGNFILILFDTVTVFESLEDY